MRKAAAVLATIALAGCAAQAPLGSVKPWAVSSYEDLAIVAANPAEHAHEPVAFYGEVVMSFMDETLGNILHVAVWRRYESGVLSLRVETGWATAVAANGDKVAVLGFPRKPGEVGHFLGIVRIRPVVVANTTRNETHVRKGEHDLANAWAWGTRDFTHAAHSPAPHVTARAWTGAHGVADDGLDGPLAAE